MTTVVAVRYDGGIVIGSDRKVVAGSIKSPAAKLFVFPAAWLVIGGAGRTRHIRDAVDWLELAQRTQPFADSRDLREGLLERRLPGYASAYGSNYGGTPEYHLVLAAAHTSGLSTLIQVYGDGEYDYVDDFVTVGSGAVFGEVLLRRLYRPQLSREAAVRLVAYIIGEVERVDNNTGEGMDLAVLSHESGVESVDADSIGVLQQLPEAIKPVYDELYNALISVPLTKEAVPDAATHPRPARLVGERAPAAGPHEPGSAAEGDGTAPAPS